MASHDILLESGTNEVEIIEFLLGDQSFSVNVAKVREIIPYNSKSITAMPDSYPSVVGMFILRDNTLPLIDLNYHLGVARKESDESQEHRVVLVCEFNDMVNGFLVDGVNQIHRCSWNEITPLSSYISKYKPSITSSITIDDRNILMVDLEHVLTDIYPKTRLVYHEEDDAEVSHDGIALRHVEREKVHIILAEDSPIVRASVKKITDEVGYTNINVYDNGQDAYDEVEGLAAKAKSEGMAITDYLGAVVTDIEMPRMDGLTVCRKIREDLGLANLPVLIFSSLVSEKATHKYESVGANGWVDKLKIEELIHILDKYCLAKK